MELKLQLNGTGITFEKVLDRMRMNFKIKKIYGITFIIYVLGLVYVSFQDIDAAILYLVCMPLCAVPLVMALRRGSIGLSAFYILFFIAMGLNPFIFFLQSDSYYSWGHMDAIGDFDFNVRTYLLYFFRIYVFSVAIYCTYIFFQSGSRHTKKDIISFMPKIREDGKYDTICSLACVIISLISIWMFEHNVGRTGIITARLPFHLSGILYYFRFFVILVIIPLTFFRSKKKKATVFVITVCALLIGLSSLSKSALSLMFLPVIFESIISRRNGRLLIEGSLYCIFFYLVVQTRYPIYSDEGIAESFWIMFKLSVDVLSEIKFNLIEIIFSTIGQLSGRLFGGQSLVLSFQYHKVGLQSFVSYYTGTSLNDIIPDMAKEMFRMTLPENMAYGVAIGLTGIVIIMANGNLFLFVFQGVVIAVLISVMDNMLYKILNKSKNVNIKLISVVTVIGVVGALYLQMLPLNIIYFATMLYFIMGRLIIRFRIRINGF